MLVTIANGSLDSLALRRLGMTVALAGLLVGTPAACGGDMAGKSEPSSAGTSPEITRTSFLPLHKGSYWVYEARDTGVNSVGLKQMLVSDQKAVGNGVRATDFVISLRDQTLPPEERPDAPMIIRHHVDGSMECFDCGGVLLPAQIEDGAMWKSTGGDGWCSLTIAPVTFRGADTQDVRAIIVQCNSVAQATSSTRVYAAGVGLVLAIFREQRDSKWVERVERLKEYRTIDSATMPPLPGGSK